MHEGARLFFRRIENSVSHELRGDAHLAKKKIIASQRRPDAKESQATIYDKTKRIDTNRQKSPRRVLYTWGEHFGEVVIIYAFYADVFWLNTFLVNWAVLLIAERLHRRSGFRALLRTLLVAAAGACSEVLILLGLHNYQFFLFLSMLAVIPLMCIVTHYPHSFVEFVRYLVICYAVTILLGGIALLLDNYAGSGRTAFLAAAIGVVLSELLARQLYQTVQLWRHCCELRLWNRGSRVDCRGLLDTGNLLRDPYGNQPVQIAGSELLKRLGVTRDQFVGMMPYRSVGREGVIAFYRIERMELSGEKGAHIVDHPLLADAGEGLFAGKPYELILNEAMQRKDG